MNYKYHIFCLMLGVAQTCGICNKPDRKHTDSSIVRCPYDQEDIGRCYSQKAYCYGCKEQRNQCFYCGCSIKEHSQASKTEKKKKK